MERDHLIELVVLVLLVLPLEQPHRLIELWPAPDGARSSVRDESAESAPVLEVVVTRERGGPTLPQIPGGSAFRRDVHGAPRGIEGMAERCDVRRASPVSRGHPAKRERDRDTASPSPRDGYAWLRGRVEERGGRSQ